VGILLFKTRHSFAFPGGIPLDKVPFTYTKKFRRCFTFVVKSIRRKKKTCLVVGPLFWECPQSRILTCMVVTPLIGPYFENAHHPRTSPYAIVTPLIGPYFENAPPPRTLPYMVVTPLIGPYFENAPHPRTLPYTVITPLIGVWGNCMVGNYPNIPSGYTAKKIF